VLPVDIIPFLFYFDGVPSSLGPQVQRYRWKEKGFTLDHKVEILHESWAKYLIDTQRLAKDNGGVNRFQQGGR
jgi:hypothetical protein